MHTIETRIEAYNRLIIDLGEQVYTAMDRAFDAFESRDKDLALTVMEDDEKINDMEAIIHNNAIEILTLLQPLARDLRLIIGGIRIANDLERIGDYAKGIARYVIRVSAVSESLMIKIHDLRILLMHNLRQTLDLLSNRDVKKAYEVALLDDDLDHMFKSFLMSLVEVSPTFLVELTGMLRDIERAGDHATNICEIVIYVENGEFIDFG